MKRNLGMLALVVVAAVLGVGVGTLIPTRVSKADEDPRLYTMWFEQRAPDRPGDPVLTLVKSEVASTVPDDDTFEVTTDVLVPGGVLQPSVGNSSSSYDAGSSNMKGAGNGFDIDSYPAGTVFTANFVVKNSQGQTIATHSISVTKP